MASILVLAPEACGGGPLAARAQDGAAAAPPDPSNCGAARADVASGNGRGMPSCTLSHVDASVSVDEPSNSMSVRARLELETGRNGSYLMLRLRPAMTVRAIAEEGGGALSFSGPLWSFYNVSLGRELSAGTALNITLSYDGPVLNTPDGGASYWDYVGPEGCWVRTYGDYFPSDENRSCTTSRLSITIPMDKTAVSHGELVGNSTDTVAGTSTFVYENRQPVSGLSFTVGNYSKSSSGWGSEPDYGFDYYFSPDHIGGAHDYASELYNIMQFYLSLLGEPGHHHLAVVEVPSTFSAWGQSTPGMMWLSSRNFDGALPYRILAHELAHQWWGIDVEGEGAGENFLQEGFAGYSEAMYEMAIHGSRGYLDYCRQQYISQFVNGPGPEPALTSNDYDLASFKGPWVLHMLRYIVGDNAFNRTLQAFHRNHYGGRADHLAFQDEVLAATGRDLPEFFYMWLYSSGRLDYAIADAVVLGGPAGVDRVQVVVESRGVLGDLPLDVGIYFEGGLWGSVPAAWNGSGPNVTLSYDVDYPVDAVRLDPFSWLLDAYPSNNEAPTRDGFYDLSLGPLNISPAEPLDNESFAIFADLTLDTSEGAQQIELGLLVDGSPAENLTVPADLSGPAQVDFTLELPAGMHSLALVADPHGLFFENDEGNNRASASVTVRPRPPKLPDLGIPPGGIALRPVNVAGGRPASIEVTVVNSGEAPAFGASVDVWVDDPQTGYVGRSAGVSVAVSDTVRAEVPWTAVSGWHQLTARLVMPEGQNDSDPGNDEATTQVYVNSPPAAVLTALARQARPGGWVDFSGALSVDDTRVAHYRFDFGDGEDTGWLADGATSHAYGVKGTYQARLMVEDDTGAESDWSAPVSVRIFSLPPQAAIRAVRRTADVLSALAFSSASCDPDGNLTELSWSFGDGGSARGPRANHTYSRKGDFNVTLTVTDDDGQSSSASVRVRVVDLPPVPAISYDGRPARVGQRVAFWGNGSGDPDDPSSALSYIWDFGDGQKASGANASYAFSGPGWHRVTLTASDGNLSAQAWVDVEVRAASPAESGGGAGVLPWAVLCLLLLSMAGLAAYIMYPFKTKSSEEEE